MPEGPIASITFHTRCADPENSSEVHQQMVEMIRWADNKFTTVTFAEHHQSGDGFMATPLQAAAMAVGATHNLNALCSAILAPLYNPLFLAEQIAFLDLTSNGRVRSVFGMGYRELEYQAADKDWSKRGAIMDTLIGQVLALLRGETVSINGVEAHLHHLPRSEISDIVSVGGSSKRAARRAAFFGMPLAPALDDTEIKESYLQRCEEYGVKPDYQETRFPGYTFIADDPESAWNVLGPYMLLDAMAYQSVGNNQRRSIAESSASNIAALRDQGVYQIVTPEQGLAIYEQGKCICINPLVGGLPSDYAWRCLELFEGRMLPYMDLDYGPYG